MERDLYASLRAWKASPRRKPLVLRGARQTGKTTLLKTFAAREYERLVYLDFELDPALDGFFQPDLEPARIVADLSDYVGFDIRPGAHLVVFDEVQASDRALTSLRYFQTRGSAFHVAAAGSLLGIKTARPGSFPVGSVSFLDLQPLSYFEFLHAVGRSRYVERLSELEMAEPIPEAIHVELIRLLRQYLLVGGMPEAVATFVDTGSARTARQVQREILDAYVLDFAKHAPATDIPKLSLIWDSLPRHLGKENRKFMFSTVRKGARSREYENALRWLEDAGLVHLCRAVSVSRSPLSHYVESSVFKVYALDVGLLGAMARVAPELAVQDAAVFTEYRGALTENYVAQALIAAGHENLHYWRSAGGKAELDFLCETGSRIVPVEVKAGLSRKSKSLRSYDIQFDPDVLVRSNLLNLKRDGKTLNLPLYAVSRLGMLA